MICNKRLNSLVASALLLGTSTLVACKKGEILTEGPTPVVQPQQSQPQPQRPQQPQVVDRTAVQGRFDHVILRRSWDPGFMPQADRPQISGYAYRLEASGDFSQTAYLFQRTQTGIEPLDPIILATKVTDQERDAIIAVVMAQTFVDRIRTSEGCGDPQDAQHEIVLGIQSGDRVVTYEQPNALGCRNALTDEFKAAIDALAQKYFPHD